MSKKNERIKFKGKKEKINIKSKKRIYISQKKYIKNSKKNKKYYFSPLILLASCISLGIIVTLFA